MRRFLLTCAILLVPGVSLAAAPRTFEELASYLVFIMNNVVAVLIVLGLVIYFWGVTANLKKASQGDAEARKNIVFWGVVALFVMVSVWGILRLLQNTLFSGGGTATLQTEGASAFCDSFGSCE